MHISTLVRAEAEVVWWLEEGGVEDSDPVEAAEDLEWEVVLLTEAIGRLGKDR